MAVKINFEVSEKSLVREALKISAVSVVVFNSGSPKTTSAKASTGSPFAPVGIPLSINLSWSAYS